MFKGNDVMQLHMFGQCLDDTIAKDHPARDFLKFAQKVPLEMFYVRKDNSGIPQYDPRNLLALCTYAFSIGQYSTRKISAVACEQFAGRFLMGGCTPTHMTIKRFMSDNVEAILYQHQEILNKGGAQGLVSTKHLIVDAHKVSASSNRDKAVKYKDYWTHRKMLEEERAKSVDKVKNLFKKLERVKEGGEKACLEKEESVGKKLEKALQKILDYDRRLAGLALSKKNLEEEAVQKAIAQFIRELEKAVLGKHRPMLDVVYKLFIEFNGILARIEQLEKEMEQDELDDLWTDQERKAIAKEHQKLKMLLVASENKLRTKLKKLNRRLMPKLDALSTKVLTKKERQRKEFLIQNARPGRNKRLNPTDADSRMMHHHRGSHPMSYNMQLAMDKESRIILYAHVTRDENDLYQLRPCIEYVRNNVGDVEKADADIGYHVHHELEMLMVKGVDLAVPPNHKKATKIKDTDQAKLMISKSETSDYKNRVAERCIVGGLFGDLSQNDWMRFLYHRGVEKVQNIIILKVASTNIQRIVKLENEAQKTAGMTEEERLKSTLKKQRGRIEKLLAKTKEYFQDTVFGNPQFNFT